MRPRVSLVVTYLLFFIASALAQISTTHPIMGIWKMKSSPTDQPKIQLRTWEFSERPEGFFLVTLLFINEAGRPRFTQAIFKPDGKEWPIYQTEDLAEFLATGKPTPQRLVVKVKDSNTIEFPQRTFTVAPDGKTMTESSSAGTTVYDRVQ